MIYFAGMAKRFQVSLPDTLEPCLIVDRGRERVVGVTRQMIDRGEFLEKHSGERFVMSLCVAGPARFLFASSAKSAKTRVVNTIWRLGWAFSGEGPTTQQA